ncbi:GDP-mannose 4,6-dehydratase, partial [Salmonella enterica subsp. enterica serovar Kentucky]|nr:GDP-mannose 4,6-dehydratase [Salmonella enterica subsp. enterica serovar Kentucky]
GVGGTVDRRVRDLRHQFGQRACMVFFGMVNDDVVDVREVDFTQEQPEDFVIATGVQYSVRQFVELAAAPLGIKLRFEGEGINEK